MTANPLSPTQGSSYAGFGAVWLCCLAAICEGFDLQVPGVSAPLVSSFFGLAPDQTGIFLSMSTFGMMLGALIGGRLSDSIGRKTVLIGSIVTYSIFTLITTFATSADMLFVLRFLTGIGLGGALPNLFALGVESVQGPRRSTAIGLILAGPGLGGALASTIAGMTPDPEHWALVYYAGSLGPLLIVVPLLYFFLPESKAVDTAASKSKMLSARDIWHTLFGAGRALRTLAVWIGLLSILMVLFVQLSWLSSFLVGRGLTIAQASMVLVAYNLSAVPGSILAGVVLDWILRRRLVPLLSLVFLGAVGASLLLAVGPSDLPLLILGGALAGVTVIGSQTMLYALAPVCYPANGRGTGVGFGVAIGRFGSAGGPLITGYLVAFGMSSQQVLLSLVPILIVAGLMCLYICSSVIKEQQK